MKPLPPLSLDVQLVIRTPSVPRDRTNPSPRLRDTVVFSIVAFFANRCSSTPLTRLLLIVLLASRVWFDAVTKMPYALPSNVEFSIVPLTRLACGTWNETAEPAPFAA